MMKFYFYKVCLSFNIFLLLFYFMTILTPFYFAKFVVSLSLGERSSGSIRQKYLIKKKTRIHMNGGGQSC